MWIHLWSPRSQLHGARCWSSAGAEGLERPTPQCAHCANQLAMHARVKDTLLLGDPTLAGPEAPGGVQ